jgi:hypothetical protein
MRKYFRRLTPNQQEQGFVLPALISAMVALSIIMLAAGQVIDANFSLVRTNNNSQKAFNIAEGGLNYYLWHLSHNSTDYKDGQTTPTTPDATLGYGPYVHDYIDDNAVKAGTYTLWIKPQGNGSSIVTVRAIGKVDKTNETRTLEAKIGSPSFGSYAVASDGALWFGNTESANGPVHSNVGIRMDGASNSDITSSNATYVPSGSLGGDGASHPGVWCNTSVTSPVNCNTRSKADWRYPLPTVNFNQVTGSLCSMKKTAFSSDPSTSSLASDPNACTLVPSTRTPAYLPQRASSFNLARGYLIELNNNGTYNLYNVNGESDRLTPYTSALTLALVASNIAIPTSQGIFAEDNIWVRSNPTFAGRLTVGAGRLAQASNANIVIADSLVYSTKNGADALGLIAEDSVIIAPYAPPVSGAFNFEINAALIAQSGNVYYPSRYRTVNTCTRGWTAANQKFSFYGSVAARQTWTWTWLWGGGCGDNAYASPGTYISGIYNNTTQYDYNMLYAPPPSFPLTSSYNILSWREVVTNP